MTHGYVELVASEIASRIRRLNNHLLPGNSTTRERQLITRTTPARFTSTRNIDRRISICQVIVHSPWRLIRALVGAATVAARRRVVVGQRVVRDIAGSDGVGAA
jgi:hypothetical protein